MRNNLKYPVLQDRNWLVQKYLVEKLSSTAIAKIVGCKSSSVTKWLHKHNIEVRDNVAARRLVPLQSFKYHQLNDKDWLYQKYVVEGLATDTIGQQLGVKTPNSVRQALIRFGIPVRNMRESMIHKRDKDGFVFNEYTHEVIEGGLLGDAYLLIYNKQSDMSAPCFCRKNKFKDHVEFVCDALGISTSIIEEEYRIVRENKCQYYRVRTQSHDALKSFYRRWYPAGKNYTKSVPSDFILTPVSLLHWFMDDGSTSYRNRKEYKPHWKKSKEQIILSFSSESFTLDENQFLAEQITKMGPRATVMNINSGTGWRIKVAQKDVDQFFNIIGPCPVPSMAYKWKLA